MISMMMMMVRASHVIKKKKKNIFNLLLQGLGTIDSSRYTGRGMGADILHKYIKLYLILIFMLRCTNHTFIENCE